MGNFNLNDYETVESRLQRYKNDFPDVRVITDVISQTEDRIMIKATLYQDIEALQKGLPHSTGIAEETRNDGFVNKTSHVENCETSALGRALANAGYSGNKNGHRASREEMEKVQRGQNAAPKSNFITDAQVKKIYALMGNMDIDKTEAVEKLCEKYQVDKLTELNRPIASKIIDQMEKKFLKDQEAHGTVPN